MRIRRREFIGVVGAAVASASVPATSSEARGRETEAQGTAAIEKSYTVSGAASLPISGAPIHVGLNLLKMPWRSAPNR